MSKEYPKARPSDHSDAAKHVAKELAGVKGEAMNWLRDPNLYTALRLRIENAQGGIGGCRGTCPGGEEASADDLLRTLT